MKRIGVGAWWNRPCGGRDLIGLALPLVVSTVSWTAMNFTDRMFLLWHSTTAVAAAMPAGMLAFTVLCFPLGVVSCANTFVAQYYGAGRPRRIGLAVRQAVWVCFLSLPLLCATIPLAPWAFALAGHNPALARLEATYYQVLMLGGGGVLLSTALSSFFTGCGRTRVVMLVDAAAGMRPEEFAPMRNLTVVLLRFVAAYTLFDAMSVIFAGALKGAGDTRFILLATAAIAPFPVLLAWWGVATRHGGLLWCWTVVTAWACAAGLVYLARFLEGGWRQIQVIEPEPPTKDAPRQKAGKIAGLAP